MAKVKDASLDQVREGQIYRTDALGRPLLLARIGGRFHAIDAICSHAGGRLEDGDFADGCVVCPVHGAIFDIATGKVSAATPWASDLEAFPVIVLGDDLLVDLPDPPLAGNHESHATPSRISAGSSEAACPFAGAARGLDFNPDDPAQRECPFDLYQRAREELPIFYSERFDLWVVTRYDDIVRILKDPAHFSSAQSLAVGTSTPPEVQAVLDTGYPATPTMVTADPPVHTRFRELVGRAFTSRRVAQMEPRMRAMAHQLIDGFYSDGHAESSAASLIRCRWRSSRKSSVSRLPAWTRSSAGPMTCRRASVRCRSNAKSNAPKAKSPFSTTSPPGLRNAGAISNTTC
jgi:nitrite reductase/ring-hydroxylating ferredoxin subunit